MYWEWSGRGIGCALPESPTLQPVILETLDCDTGTLTIGRVCSTVYLIRNGRFLALVRAMDSWLHGAETAANLQGYGLNSGPGHHARVKLDRPATEPRLTPQQRREPIIPSPKASSAATRPPRQHDHPITVVADISHPMEELSMTNEDCKRIQRRLAKLGFNLHRRNGGRR